MVDSAPAPAEVVPAGSTRGVPARHPMEIWISYVLRFGVLLAGAVILLGLTLFVAQEPLPGQPATPSNLAGRNAEGVTISPSAIANGVRAGDPIAIIEIGVLMLIFTPIVRVAMTVVLFTAQQDHAFVLFSAIVLSILAAALIVPAT